MAEVLSMEDLMIELSLLSVDRLRSMTVSELRAKLKPVYRGVSRLNKDALVSKVLDITEELRLERRQNLEAEKPADDSIKQTDFIVKDVKEKLDNGASPSDLAIDIWSKLTTVYSMAVAMNRSYEIARKVEADSQDVTSLFGLRLREVVQPYKQAQKTIYREKVNKAATLTEYAEVIEDDAIVALDAFVQRVVKAVEAGNEVKPIELMAVLAAVTGRRMSETILGVFEPVDGLEYQMMFRGQLKGHRGDAGYIVRTLIKADKVLMLKDALDQYETPDNPEDINNKYAKAALRLLKGIQFSYKFHKLRAIYAAFLAETMPTEHRLKNVYVASNLYPYKPGDPISDVVNSYIASDLSEASVNLMKSWEVV